MPQAKRYITLHALTERGELDSSYHAAFYLLSSDADICEKAYNHIDIDGIDFAGLIKSCRSLDEPQQQLLSVARNLSHGRAKRRSLPLIFPGWDTRTWSLYATPST